MSIVALIQARMGSTRLPGKVLEAISGQSMLARVCQRAQRAMFVDQVVVATTDLVRDQPIVEECRRLGLACFRGNEEDVLDRYDRASKAHQASVVVRITADCPLIDPEVVDRVVQAFLQDQPDYASNTLERTWPRGLDTEVMSAESLARACCEAVETYERIHVTPYLYRHPDRFRLRSVTGEHGRGDDRWTVDCPEDLAFVRAIYERLPNQEDFSWGQVRQVLKQEPHLAQWNRHVRQKRLAEG